MAKGISYGGKIHKNRDKEFFNSIVGKYRVSENSLSFLPKLIYLETAHMISYIAGNRFFLNEKLNLKNFSIEKQVYNNYFSYTSKKISISNYGTGNYRTNNCKINIKNAIGSSYSGQENVSYYKAKPNITITENTIRNQSFESINGVNQYGTGILAGSSYSSLAKKGTTTKEMAYDVILYFLNLNNIMRQFFSESNGSVEIEGFGPVFFPKTVQAIASRLSVINNTGLMAQRSTTMAVDHGSLDSEIKGKTENTNRNFKKETLPIDDRYFYSSGSKKNSKNHGAVYRRNGVKEAKPNIPVTENTGRNQSFERNTNEVDGYGTGILTGSCYASLAKRGTTRALTPERLYFPVLNNIMRQFFFESNGSMGVEGFGTMISTKTVRVIASKLSVINNTGLMVQRSNTMTADHYSLARETKAKTGNTNRDFKKDTLQINDRFYGSGSENNSNSYSAVYCRNGIKANAGSIYSQSPGLELALNEAARNKTKKSEAPSQNVVSEGTKEVNKQNPLDINKIVSQVYNELERKFRIERERRGL